MKKLLFWLRLPFMVLYKTYFVFLFIFYLLLLYPFFLYNMRRKNFKRGMFWFRVWSWLMRLSSGMILQIHGKKNLPTGPYILVSNHSSYLDIIFMYQIIQEHFVFMGKAELNRWPLIRIFFNSGMNISVNRSSRKESHRALQEAREVLQDGKVLVIFPEGTIPGHVPKLKRFKNGAFKLAIDTGVPIVPVTFTSNFKRMMNGGYFKAVASPGICPCYIHEPIETTGLSDEDLVALREQTFEIVKSKVPGYGN